MAEFIYTTQTTIPGPCLLDADKLEALDKVLDDEWEPLAKRNQEAIRTEVDRRLEDSVQIYAARLRGKELSPEELQSLRKEIEDSVRGSYGYREYHEITLFYEKGKRAEVTSFREAMRQPALLEEVIVRFRLEVVCGDISCKISIDENRGALDISASPERMPEARELFAALHRWGTTNRPPKWQQIWRTWNGAQWFIWLAILAIGLIVVTESFRNPYKEEARELVKNGVSQENQQRALELLLAIQSEYRSPDQKSQIPTWFIILLLGGLVVCFITSFVPKSVLGIGKGQDRINHWRIWLSIVFYLVPSFLFLNIIWPLISSWILPK